MKKDFFTRTKEEQEIENAIARGEYTSVKNLADEKARYAKIAQNTIAQKKTITVRITQRDLARLKAKAMQEGVPYQTYITSLIHKNV